MTLDRLYSLVKKARFPIKDREDIIHIIGNTKISFDGHFMNCEEIAVHMKKYPIKSASEFFKYFLEEEAEAYNTKEAKALGAFEVRLES
jgi:hypothetical protein